MEVGGGNRHAGAPRTLDVQQFANARGAEVQALYAVLKERKKEQGKKDAKEKPITIPRCLRRRTTSHNRRKSFFWQRKERKRKRGAMDEPPVTINGENGEVENGDGDVAVPPKKPPCRRIRRRIELKGDEDGGGGCSKDGTQRLVTHVWHAKRFKMTKIWGHWLPEGLPGRGRGSRVVIKWAKEDAVLQDASFYSAIELQGSGESIIEALQLVLEPAPILTSSMSSQDQAVYNGVQYGKAMLHHIGRYPHGTIAPVTYLWRPEPSEKADERRVWVWVHAAAFEEALACLQVLCQSQRTVGDLILLSDLGAVNDLLLSASPWIILENQEIADKHKLQCCSRKGQLGRLDLSGREAISVLRKVLHPVTRQKSQGRVESAHSSNPCEGSSIILRFLEEPHIVPESAVLGIEVWDPRDPPHSEAIVQPSVRSKSGSDKAIAEDMEMTSPSSSDGGDDEATSSDNRHTEVKFKEADLKRQLLDNRQLWEWLGTKGHPATKKPLSEKDLSTRRHKKRMSFIKLNDLTADAQLEVGGTSENSKCPVLVLKHHHRQSTCGFSIILPIAWIRAFWVPLVFAGGHVIGLRERHWLHTDVRLPSFPHDFPDCSSYNQYMDKKAVEYQEAYNAKPPSKRGLWNLELPIWKFGNEAPKLHRGIYKAFHYVPRTESRLGVYGDTVATTPLTDPVKSSGDNLVSLSSDVPEAPAMDLVATSSSQPAEVGIDRQVKGNDGAAAADTEGPSPKPNEAVQSEDRERIEGTLTSKSEVMLGAEMGLGTSDSGTAESFMFVARTKETLDKALRDCGLHLLSIPSSRDGAIDFPITAPPGDGSNDIVHKGCLVRVSIRAPRKGNFDAGAIIYFPQRGDFESYIAPSQIPRWQGFEDPSFNQLRQQTKRKKKEGKAKGEGIIGSSVLGFNGSELPPVQLQSGIKFSSATTSSAAALSRITVQSSSLRIPIGTITSPVPRGSKLRTAVGVCEVGSLCVLRAKQMAYGTWEGTDIFVLARAQFSSHYRPALVSIPVEHGDDLL